MNRSFILIFFACFGLTSFTGTHSGSQPGQPNKHALIIAIGDYERSTGWLPISSGNDIPIVTGALLKLGFAEKNIAVLTDADADKNGIIEALRSLSQRVSPGDMVVIHVSAHGQQISDDNDDEVDGYDEAIVGYGAPVSHRYYRSRGGRGAYDGSLHLRDEEFGARINDIRARIGKNGHVLTVLDACHSGTGTRGSARVRGGEEPFVLDTTAQIAPVKKETGGFGMMGEGAVNTRGDNLGKFVLISGASAHEVNYETEDENGNGVGSLSYCLSKVLASVPKGTTYRSLFAAVLSEMASRAPKQTPQLEGDIDFEIFGGSFRPQEKYFAVTSISGNRELVINAGKLMNVYEGTSVAVERSGSSGPSKDKKPLATGKVVSASNFEATILLEQALDVKSAVDVWVFVTGAVLPERKVRVDISKISDAGLRGAVGKAIGELGMAEVVTNRSDLVLQDVKTRGAYAFDIINAAYGSKLVEQGVRGNSLDHGVKLVTDVIHNYAQGSMFRELDLRDDGYNVVINRVLPVKRGSKDFNDIVDPSTHIDEGNIVNIPAGTYIFLELKNLGDQVAYFNIVDIEPSGRINPLVPSVIQNRIEPPIEELRLNPGETRILKYPIRIGPPYGTETFKVIATGVAFDLASTIRVPEFRTRGNTLPVQKLLGESFNRTSTRGAELEQGEMGTNTSEFTFKIVR